MQGGSLNLAVGIMGAAFSGIGNFGARAAGAPSKGFIARGVGGMLEHAPARDQALVGIASGGPSGALDYLGFDWAPWVDQGSN